jgi:hypothetical protein
MNVREMRRLGVRPKEGKHISAGMPIQSNPESGTHDNHNHAETKIRAEMMTTLMQ